MAVHGVDQGGKYALNWTRLSCQKFVVNQVTLWLFVLAYNLGSFLRRLVLPEDMDHWTLTSLQTRGRQFWTFTSVMGQLPLMRVGQLSESDAVDALRMPFYSSRHARGSHTQGHL